MKIELPESVAEQLREPLARCRDNGELSPAVLVGQVMCGTYPDDPKKVFLHLCTIKPATARRVRKVIEKERALTAATSA